MVSLLPGVAVLTIFLLLACPNQPATEADPNGQTTQGPSENLSAPSDVEEQGEKLDINFAGLEGITVAGGSMGLGAMSEEYRVFKVTLESSEFQGTVAK